MCYVMTQDLLLRYDHYLGAKGYSKATFQKYKGDLQQFYIYQGGETVDEETCRAYQRYLMEHYRAQMIFLIVGLMLGSLYSVVLGPTTLEPPRAAMELGTFRPLFFLLGGVSIIVKSILLHT